MSRLNKVTKWTKLIVFFSCSKCRYHNPNAACIIQYRHSTYLLYPERKTGGLTN